MKQAAGEREKTEVSYDHVAHKRVARKEGVAKGSARTVDSLTTRRCASRSSEDKHSGLCVFQCFFWQCLEQ